MRTRAILSVAGLAAATLAVVPFSTAHADTGASGVALPLSSYYQMAVDSVHDHLFFSQGSTGQNGILVTDFSGKTVTTITGQTGVMGITLSPDGSTLYAALSGAHAVTAISTATLQQTARLLARRHEHAVSVRRAERQALGQLRHRDRRTIRRSATSTCRPQPPP